jgi:hypothetical protein
MFLLTESEEAALEGDLPWLPTDRWWGERTIASMLALRELSGPAIVP